MNELIDLLGETKPSFHNCIIAVTFDRRSFIVTFEDAVEDAYDGSDLEDNLTDTKNIPKEPGIYRCVIRYHCFKCNIPIDPEEWDCRVTIESCELIKVCDDFERKEATND